MSVIKYIQLPFRFDAQRIEQEVKSIAAQHWQLHYQTKHYTGGWSAISLRSVNGSTESIVVSPLADVAYKDTVFLEQSDYLKEVLSVFNCPLKAVRLLKLDAGAVVKKHKDAELSYEYGEIRIHIPVVTNDQVEFYLDQERMLLKEGECWYMNFNLPHAIENKSDSARIHLVIDAVVNDWVKELFAQPSLLIKEINDPGFDEATRKQIIAQLRQLGTETANQLADDMELNNA
jgi:quercetin dioxygenase-like cupin family protein